MTAKISPRRTGGPQRRALRVPNDACPTCGTLMKSRSGRLSFPVNGVDISVPSIAHLRCPKCGEVLLNLSQAQELDHGAHAAYRRRFRLLSPADIRAIREKYGLTQAQLAKLLRLGGNTISRWEADRKVQTAAMDVLLRLLRDLPASLRYLKKHAA